MKISEQINKTKSTLFESGWTRASGVVEGEDGLCILSGRAVALGKSKIAWARDAHTPDGERFCEFVDQARRELGLASREPNCNAAYIRVYGFNDLDSTTFNDVVDVLDLAEKKALIAEESI